LLLPQRENGRLLSAVKYHIELDADSSSTSVEVEDSSAGSQDDESKPISKRRRLLQTQRVDVPDEEAIRPETWASAHRGKWDQVTPWKNG